MAFLSIIFSCPETLYENIIAELSDTEIDSYYETESLIAYVDQDKWSDTLKANLDSLSVKYGIKYELELLQEINWNAVWESNFDPVSIDDFCYIRADFHPKKPGYAYEIEISPKMAFGTGHHETTFMMIQQMAKLKIENIDVLDYGCGTGILGILASKMGAQSVEAIDIDINSIENSKEHIALNGVERVLIKQGDLDAASKDEYGLILANINRGVLLDQANSICGLLKDGAILLMSGILETDREIIEEKYLNAGLKIVEVIQKGEWLCFYFVKSINS